MYSKIKKPRQRLSKDAVKVWIISDTIGNVIGLLLLIGLFYLDLKYAWSDWIHWILIVITILAVVGGIWSYIRPFLLYKNWRYDVDEEFLQLKFGAFNEIHHLVPMTKIQSVATQQGPILRKYGLYSISVETMASSHMIPALPEKVAKTLRDEIAHYAKIREVES